MNDTNEAKAGGFLNDKQYNAAKYLSIVVLPAIGTLYFAIAQIWGLPHGEQVLGTILAIEAFLGVCLGVSTNQYEKSGAKYSGDINIVEAPSGQKSAQFSFDEHPTTLADKDEATFKVNTIKSEKD